MKKFTFLLVGLLFLGLQVVQGQNRTIYWDGYQ